MSASASRPSQLSMASLRESASGLPRRKVFSWVAQWFTLSQLLAKTITACLSVVSASLVLAWESEGVTVQDLDTNSFQFRGRVNTFVAVGFVSVAYAIAMVIVGLVGVKVHAKVLTCVSAVVLLLWFLSAPIMSATVTELGNSRWARWRDIDVTQLEVATGLGFLCLVVAVVDILLAFLQLSEMDNECSKFSVEVETSRSTIQAVRSGQSMPLSVTGTVRQRSSRTISSLRQSHDPDTAEEEETLVATDDVTTDDTLDVDEDSTWEAISHDAIPLTTFTA